MVNYREDYNKMRVQIKEKHAPFQFDGTMVDYGTIDFKSLFHLSDDLDKQPQKSDLENLLSTNIPENDQFVIPVMMPHNASSCSNAILFLHGLNERSWDKYLVWAKYLVEQTNKPVVMFPIAFHMNRSPKGWGDPHEMACLANERRSLHNNDNASFANAALSLRLESNPQQMFISGVQSYYDIVRFVEYLKSGENHLFAKDVSFDIFSYSIGSFLSEILLINNPHDLFSSSKLFMFCGGATFDCMDGISKFILDKLAFLKLAKMRKTRYLRRLRKDLLKMGVEGINDMWMGLQAMVQSKRGRNFREKRLKVLENRIYAVALLQDKVIPPDGVLQTLKGKNRKINTHVEVFDFPYKYSHEQPFPTNDASVCDSVNACFDAVFDRATLFLR